MTDRGGTPKPLGDALKSFLAERGLAHRVEQAGVLGEWSSIVGAQISSITEPRSITEDGTLFVKVRTSAWMNELSLREPEILGAIRSRLPKLEVRRIRWLLWND